MGEVSFSPNFSSLSQVNIGKLTEECHCGKVTTFHPVDEECGSKRSSFP